MKIVISEIIIVKLILVGLVLFAVLWLLKFTWKNTPIRKTLKAKLNAIIPFVEALIWLGFILWCIRQLIRDDLWTSIGVFAVVVVVLTLLTWFVARDYFAGILLKSDGTIKINDWIRIKGVEGKITQMGQRSMLITSNSGETINIPYNTLSDEISIKPNPSEKLISHTFELKISKQMDLDSSIHRIRKSILNAPWASIKKVPEVKFLNDTVDLYHFEITIYSIRLLYFQKIKDLLRSNLSKTHQVDLL